MAAIVAVTWNFSAERETWARRPEPGGWYPSRKYVQLFFFLVFLYGGEESSVQDGGGEGERLFSDG